MITIYLSGGLGNQMFQFSAAYQISLYKKTSVKINIANCTVRNYELDIFPLIKNKFIPSKFKTSLNLKVLRPFNFFFRRNDFFESHPFVYDLNIEKVSNNTNLVGYFQSEKYFLENRKDILNIFKFEKSDDSKFLSIKKIIEDSQSVSIHVRRGDYVENKNANKYHGTLPISYYKKATNFIVSHVKNPKFFLFSDDLHWAKQNFSFLQSFYLVDINTGKLAYRDMHLMSLCKHNIIANSSFSWWGAWLNQNSSKIVIAPRRWVKEKSEPILDIIPKSWHAL